jgi:hypothetical protein
MATGPASTRTLFTTTVLVENGSDADDVGDGAARGLQRGRSGKVAPSPLVGDGTVVVAVAGAVAPTRGGDHGAASGASGVAAAGAAAAGVDSEAASDDGRGQLLGGRVVLDPLPAPSRPAVFGRVDE